MTFNRSSWTSGDKVGFCLLGIVDANATKALTSSRRLVAAVGVTEVETGFFVRNY